MIALLDKGVAPVFFITKTRAAKSCPFLVFSFIPAKSFSTFQVILIIGVLFRSIFTFLPNPDAAYQPQLLENFHFH